VSRSVSRAAALAGALAGFVAGVDLLRALRPALLVDPEPAWAAPRLLLGLAVAAGSSIFAGRTVDALLLHQPNGT